MGLDRDELQGKVDWFRAGYEALAKEYGAYLN